MKVQFLGAAGTVTGSKFLLSHGSRRVLVDCGMFQGYKQLRLRNWSDLPVPESTIDLVILTHAHIDHSGWLPALVKRGFRGRIYATDSTRDLCEILLMDSARIQEEEAAYANKRGHTKHRPALPLYDRHDVERTLPLFEVVDFGERRELGEDMSFEFIPAGHILGAAFIALTCSGTRFLFSGDLGRPGMPIMRDPERVTEADYLFLESTYGRRLHGEESPLEELAGYASRTLERGGILLIPSFAVARAQTLCILLHQLKELGRIPDVPVYLNSPMATNVTKLYVTHHDDHRLSVEECERVFAPVNYVSSVEESKELNKRPGPMIVISSSGMATAGRVLHHIKAWGGGPKNTILFVGFQAGGTRGRDLIEGAKSVKIHGEYVRIRAEVGRINSLSAHSDYEDTLRWMTSFTRPPRMTFLVHGEPDSLDAMRKHIEEGPGWACTIPEHGEVVEF